MKKPVQERFDEKFIVDDNGCHLWTASLTPTGYGNFTFSTGRPLAAHRAAWVLAGRELPVKPLVLDHICNVRHCVNVDHLQVITYSANTLKGATRTNTDTCRAGLHPWVPVNWFPTSDGYVTCYACKLEKQRAGYHRRKTQ
jgi:hypothetical protein